MGSRLQKTPLAERMDAVDRAGILSFRGMKSLQPARQLILGVRQDRGAVAVVLFANGDFLTSIAVAVIAVIGGAIAAGVPVWLKYRFERKQHEADLSASRGREKHFEEELDQLKQSMAKLLKPIPKREGQVDIQQIVPHVRQLADAVTQLQQEAADLNHRMGTIATIQDTLQGLRQQVAKLEQRITSLEQKMAKPAEPDTDDDDDLKPPPEDLAEMVPLVAREFKAKYGSKTDKYQRRYLHLWQRPGHGPTLVYRISGETGTANHRVLVPEGGNTLAEDRYLKDPLPEQIIRAFEQAIRGR